MALPVNWKKGDKVIVPPPKTLEEMNERLKANGDLEKVDFYLVKKTI